MSFISMSLVVAPVCAALSLASGYAQAEDHAAGHNARSHVESFVTESMGITEAKAAIARPAIATTSTRAEDELSAARANVPAPAQALTDPELPVAPLENYRLELNNCCGPDEE
ncbi:MAG TPA: hypothetical protein VEH51_06040 [Burkholderiales bacterium]|nr:hypothetical protein [Burkholderiales bacterium]